MAEKWDLYDAERKKTGRTIERGERMPEGCYHLAVSVWIKNSKGQYLLTQRHPDKEFPGTWECTGGSVLAGEDSLQGGLREVQEELGIRLDPRGGKRIRQVRRDQRHDFYDVWMFHADVPLEELTLQATEVTQAMWVDREQLEEMYRRGDLHPLIDYIDILE